MGIQNFFQEFGQAKQPKNISDYEGQKCAVDGYVWMHQAIYARQVNNDAYKKLDRFVAFFQSKIDRLHRHNIKTIIVWDGEKLPMKQKTNTERFLDRKKNYEEAIKKFKDGKIPESLDYFRKAISITPGLVHAVQIKLKNIYEEKIEFITAPYEADSQLVYLNQIGYVDFIISVDSDLMVFGAKNVFYKMDHYFNGEEYTQERVMQILRDYLGEWAQLIDLIKICVLRGCDYLESPRGIGMKTAMKLYKDYKNIYEIVKKSRYNFSEQYLFEYFKSYLTFRFMWVYCPIEKKRVNLNKNPTQEESNLLQKIQNARQQNFLGQNIKDNIAQQIAIGEIDPITKTSFIKEFDLLYKINKHKTKNNQEFDISFSIILSELEKQFLVDYNQNKSHDDSSLLDDRRKINHELLMQILQDRQIRNMNISKLPIDSIHKLDQTNQTINDPDMMKVLDKLDNNNYQQNYYSQQPYTQRNLEDIQNEFKKFSLKYFNNKKISSKNLQKKHQGSKDDMSSFLYDKPQISFLLQDDLPLNDQKQNINNQNFEYFSFQNSQQQNQSRKMDEFTKDIMKCIENGQSQTNQNIFKSHHSNFQKLKSIDNTISQNTTIQDRINNFQNGQFSQNGILQQDVLKKDLQVTKEQLKKDPKITIEIPKEVLDQHKEININILIKQLVQKILQNIIYFILLIRYSALLLIKKCWMLCHKFFKIIQISFKLF